MTKEQLERKARINILKEILFTHGLNQKEFSKMLGMNSRKALWNYTETSILNKKESFDMFIEGYKNADPMENDKFYKAGMQVSLLPKVDLVGMGEIQKNLGISQSLCSFYFRGHKKINLGFQHRSSKNFVTREVFEKIKAKALKK